METEQWLGQDNQLGMDIWKNKYCCEGEDFEQWLTRVSGGNEEIAQYIREKKFLFGGRILSNRGLHDKGRKVTYSNCYVIAPPEDEIESIFDCAKKLARTYSYGGGCGIDISTLSPRGARINNAAKETSGAVSFMELYSLVTALIGQNGRRGALMISIDCAHPDVEEFIDLKTDLEKVTKANISVRIREDFMEAVKKNEPYLLHYTRQTTGEVIERWVNARELFHHIAETNWDYAEPGALFWDRVRSWILTSGTLAAGGNFQRSQTLLGLAGDKRVKTSVTPSPFPYEKNCLLYLPSAPHVPMGGWREVQYLSEQLLALVEATHGHTLVLFTSYKLMGAVYRQVKDALGFPLFEMWRNGAAAIQEFKASENAVLFAAGSCWEGVDFPGDMVSSLVLPRLPFPVPDPLSQAEQEQFPSLEDYLQEVILPDMQVKLRQGFGRAIRSETDTYVVSLLDQRAALGGRYHQAAVEALPPVPVTDKLEDVAEFIRTHKEPHYFA